MRYPQCPKCYSQSLMFEPGQQAFCCNCKKTSLIIETDVQRKWDLRFLRMARDYANECSKDPSTKAGAVIADDNQLVSMGYNGFARGVDDSPDRYADRDLKIATIVHAEENAILLSKRNLEGFTLYTYPFSPCSHCSSVIIQSGIKRCVAPAMPQDKAGRWQASMDLAIEQFRQAGVEFQYLEIE